MSQSKVNSGRCYAELIKGTSDKKQKDYYMIVLYADKPFPVTLFLRSAEQAFILDRYMDESVPQFDEQGFLKEGQT